MLLLVGTTDKLQVVTASAGTIDVHASWMDNVLGSVSPGRANTNITTATTTDVVGSSGATTTQRNIKTLHIRNRNPAPNTITVQHTDGTTVSQLYKITLGTNQTLQYIDEIGFIVPPQRLAVPVIPRVFAIAGNATYTPTPGMAYCVIECVGGGAGGSGGSGVANQLWQFSGGGSGGYSRKVATALDIGVSQPVVIGVGGAGGIWNVGGAVGSPGGDTSVGTLCVAKGAISCPSQFTAGPGAPTGTGDFTSGGAPGEGGFISSTNSTTYAYMATGSGGSSAFGGGGSKPAPWPGDGNFMAAVNARSYGSGGSGSACNSTGAGPSGGNGSAGVAIITEHF